MLGQVVDQAHQNQLHLEEVTLQEAEIVHEVDIHLALHTHLVDHHDHHIVVHRLHTEVLRHHMVLRDHQLHDLHLTHHLHEHHQEVLHIHPLHQEVDIHQVAHLHTEAGETLVHEEDILLEVHHTVDHVEATHQAAEVDTVQVAVEVILQVAEVAHVAVLEVSILM